MTNTLPDFKRKALESRRTHLIEEYEAVNVQLDRALSSVERLRLQRTADDLERQIAEIEAQLGQFGRRLVEIEAKLGQGEPQMDTTPVHEGIYPGTKPSSELGPNVGEKAGKDSDTVGTPLPVRPTPPPSKTLTWLHLSDLHFRGSRSYDENIVLKALLRDVADRIEKEGLQPDFIAITGDVAFSGKPDEYKLAGTFFDELLKTTKLPSERLFVVPGNHDVDRSQVTPGAQAMTDALSDRNRTNAILANVVDFKLVMQRFKGYAKFVKDYFGGHIPFNTKQYFYVRDLPWSGPRVKVLGLNSAWVCASDNDKTPGVLLGERQTRAALEPVKSEDLKIALLHHPFDWLRDFDQRDSAAMLLDGCNFILHGHLHHTATTQLSGPDTHAMGIGGGACYETREYPNMYNFVRLDLDARTGTVYLRRYSDERGGFWATDTLTYKNAPEGKYIFEFKEKR